MRPRASRFEVEYTYGKAGGSHARTRMSTSTTNLENSATRSETGVLAALDPFPWTPSERWIRWHAWDQARAAGGYAWSSDLNCEASSVNFL